jgi:hypothetical protein
MSGVGEKSNLFSDYYILVGEKVFEPVYKEQPLSEYRGNPLIEALPPIFSKDAVIKKHLYYPEMPDDLSLYSPEIRFQMLQRIKDFYLPTVEFIEVERQLSSLIRRGYTARNPVKGHQFFQLLQELNEAKLTNDEEKIRRLASIQAPNRTTASSYSVIGVSGIGKSTAIEKILMMYPQVIYHSEYDNKPFTRTQIVWLKMDCPYDGSLKTLCRGFFSAIDNVLGTTSYFQKYGNPKNSTALMMVHMAYVSALHSIGVIIIDEIQHLLASKIDSEEMLNFFVTLVNTIGMPVFYIGTYKAMKVLNRDFRQARRVGTDGVLMWDRMEEDKKWGTFLENLWDFQYLSDYTELDKNLKNTMYELSQGITSVAVALFILAQKRAIGREECITKNMLETVFEKDLAMIKPMLNALKNNNIRDLSRYEDLVIDIDKLMLAEISQHNDLQEVLNVLNSKRQARLNEANKSNSTAINTRTKQFADIRIEQPPKFDNADLRSIYQKAAREKVNSYNSLKEAGYIDDPYDELGV